jgi:hypothetical protein
VGRPALNLYTTNERITYQYMSITFLNIKSKGITKTVARHTKQDGQSNKEYRDFLKEQVVEYRNEGLDVFKSPRSGDGEFNE